ncbi:MAG: hypothetical protein PHS96_14325 [Anaerolineales bacterium]|nr:hypothetical protein [Anaerolineales bacterium]
MNDKATFTKTLAIIGTVLVWLPILAPVFFSLVALVAARRFRFDYLMPAELFPVALLGGALLVWATLRARSRRGLVGWGLGVAIAMLVGGQALAVATGLASGEIEPAGIWWTLVLGSLVIFILALLMMGVGGILLLRDLFIAPGASTGNA